MPKDGGKIWFSHEGLEDALLNKLTPMTQIDNWARKFHDLYEKLAPKYGYETREDTKEFDPESPNGKLMTEVCNEIITLAKAEGAAEERKRIVEEIEKVRNEYIKHSLDIYSSPMIKIIACRVWEVLEELINKIK